MGLLSDLKKIMFGAKAITKSAADKAIDAGTEAGGKILDNAGDAVEKATEKATDLGGVAVVQALGGLQYVFILIISVVFAQWLPVAAADRDTRPQTFFRRLLYVVVILVGFIALFT